MDLGKPYKRVVVYGLALHCPLFAVSYGPEWSGILLSVIGAGVIMALLRAYADGYSLVLFIAQIFYSYLAVSLVPEAARQVRPNVTAVADVLLLLIAGFVSGHLAGMLNEVLIRTGKWIWVVPVPMLVYSYLHDLLFRCEFCSDANLLYFSSGRLDNQLITLPSFWTIGYSIGLALLQDRAKKNAPSTEAQSS